MFSRAAALLFAAVGLAACEHSLTNTTDRATAPSVGAVFDATMPDAPAGLVKVTERPFNALSEDGWAASSYTNFAIAQDATAPKSPTSIGTVTFPAGMTGGDSPFSMEHGLPGSPSTYVTFWMKLSPGFASGGTNQLFYLWLNGTQRAVIGFTGSGATGALTPVVSLRNIVNYGGATTLTPNVNTGVRAIRGQWQQWELVLTANTGSNADGVVEWYVDGVKAGSYRNVEFVSSTSAHSWQTLKFDPIWGNARSTVPATQTLAFDHLFASAGTITATAPPPPAPAPVASLAVSPATATLAIGGTVQLTATAYDSSGATLTGRTVTFASSNPAVATVSAAGVVTGISAGTSSITATSETKTASSAITVSVPTPPPTATGCANAASTWIFCDDFEQDRSSSYFEYDAAGGSFTRVAGAGRNGGSAMRAHFSAGQVNAGSLKLAFGRTPSTSFKPVDGGTTNYREIYWRVYVRAQNGWVPGAGDKLTRATVFAKSDWSQAMVAHVWSGSSPDQAYLFADPVRGTDASGNLVTVGYNDFAHFTWLGAQKSTTALYDAVHNGSWVCIEAHVKLNDAGQSNGLEEVYMNGTRTISRTGLNFLGSYANYGLNAIFLENYSNNGSAQAQDRDLDDFVVSTAPIGCDATTPSGTTSTTPTISKVSVSPASSALVVGQTQQLVATATDATGTAITGQPVTFSSSAPSVASVSASGLVTALAAGSATIQATSNGVTGTSSVSVTAPAPTPVATTVSVTAGSTALAVGQSTQLSATVRDQSGNVMSGQPVGWVSSATSVATVSTSGVATAIGAGSATITATSGAASGSVALSVSAPTPVSTTGSWPNEPANMTQLTQTSWSSLTEDGWTPYYNGLSIVQDATAPKSPSSVAQVYYPAGFAGGDSPGLFERNLGSTATTMYVSFWMKLSDNWYGHATGTNKIMHFWIGGSNRVYFFASGGALGSLQPYIGLQGVQNYGGSANLSPNIVPTAQVIRGQWQRWEVVMKANSSGAADGTLDWWVDGQKVGSYSGIQFTSGAATWELVKWDPTWGGLGGTLPAAQYMWMDHIYMSGR